MNMRFFFFFPFESASPKGKSVVLCVAFSAEEEARSATSELSGFVVVLLAKYRQECSARVSTQNTAKSLGHLFLLVPYWGR